MRKITKAKALLTNDIIQQKNQIYRRVLACTEMA